MARQTRYEGLGYQRFAANHWQFVDLTSTAGKREAQIGAIYPTKAELLADVERFAQARGFADIYESSPISREVPPCAASMGCLCAGHARGAPASAPCDTSELPPPRAHERSALPRDFDCLGVSTAAGDQRNRDSEALQRAAALATKIDTARIRNLIEIAETIGSRTVLVQLDELRALFAKWCAP